MKKFTITLLLLTQCVPGICQSISGTWYGSLNVNGTILPLIFHIASKEAGYGGTMDSPNQKAFGIPVDEISYVKPNLKLEVKAVGVTYEGIYKADSDKFDGKFRQKGIVMPMVLTKTAPITTGKEIPKSRPQDPISFPYRHEEVKFTNDQAKCTLAGTLTLPSVGKPSSIVVLITGSGPQNRDEELNSVNHRPFLVWSDWLTRQGIGVLRYDDRGTAASTGNYASATANDFAKDAEAAVAYLRARKDLTGIPIGLIGHSEGGMVAPLVAASNSGVSFVVLLAAPGVPINQLLLKQSADVSRLMGIPVEDISAKQIQMTRQIEFIMANNALAQEDFRKGLTKYLQETVDTTQAQASSVKTVIASQVEQMSLPAYRYFVSYKPHPALSKLKCPVLAINGTLDCQVSCDENLAAIKAALDGAGNRQSKIEKLAGLNHLFQKAKTGSPAEYSTIEETVNPVALQTVSNWIKRH